LLPSLGTGEAIISGQCVSFPILTKITLAKTEGVYEEVDAFEDLLKWKQSNHPQSQIKNLGESNQKKLINSNQKNIIIPQIKFPEQFDINSYIINISNLKTAEQIYDDSINLSECSLDLIECEIMGTHNYKIIIDFKKKILMHDCQDYIRNKMSKKKFCKHLIKLFKFLEGQENFGPKYVEFELNVIGNDINNWSFK